MVSRMAAITSRSVATFEAHPPGFLQVRQDRRDPDVIQPGGDAVGLFHLAFVVLEKIGLVALGHADAGIVGAQA
jgi:hypothetical protein